MNQLESIDLTQGNRFERSLKEDAQKKKSDEDRGIHRLKKGEIPHVSTSNSYITISSDLVDLNDWVINVNSMDLADSLDNQIIQRTSRINTTSNSTWITSSTDNNFIWTNLENTLNTWTVNDTTSFSLNYTNYYTPSYNKVYDFSDASDKSIDERIGLDPFVFGEVISSTTDIEHRLNDLDYIYYERPYSIPKCLTRDDTDYSWFNDTDDALSRISNKRQQEDAELMNDFLNLHILHDSIANNDREQLLKIYAPFIKRVYVTSGGRSFDTKDLHFDMVLAQEHFNDAIRQRI